MVEQVGESQEDWRLVAIDNELGIGNIINKLDNISEVYFLFGQDSWRHAIKTFIPCLPYGTHRVHFVLSTHLISSFNILKVQN